MPDIEQSFRRYLYSLTVLGVAILLRALFTPWLEHHLSHATVFAAVLLNAWYFGTGPALSTIVLGYLGIEFFILRDPSDYALSYFLPSLTLYLIVNAVALAFVHRLRRVHEKYAIVANNTFDWEFWLSPDGDFMYSSPSCSKVTGYTAEDFKKDPDLFYRLIHPEDRKLYEEHRGGRLAQTCVTDQVQFRIIHRDGSVRWIDHACRPLNTRGKFLGIRGSNRDITDRKEAEQRIQELNDRLQVRNKELVEERARWKRVVQGIADELWVCDKDGRISLLNLPTVTHMRLEKFSDRTVEEIAEELEILSPDGQVRPYEQAPLLRSLKGEIVRGEEIMRHRRTGTTRWRQFASAPIYDATGSISGSVAIVRDITAEKQTEEALEAARRAAEEANSAKDQFLAVLSHELRTPLAPVLAGISLLQRKQCGSCNLSYELQVVKRNIEMEARLIDDLLDLTRIVRGKISLTRETVDVRSILGRVIETCRADLDVRKQEIATKFAESLLPVSADQARLQQIFWNLLKNAIKFSPDGGKIDVIGYIEREQAIVEVIDKGIGIETEALQRIFNSFEQADQKITRQFGGLGLGLAISKKLVEMHEGSIVAESEGKGKGATFRVTLPLAPSKTIPDEISAQAVTRTSGRSIRVLLVEDHGDTAEMTSSLLRSHGYYVKTAADVTQALQAIGSETFDVLVSDLGLPGQSGLDLMTELRARGSPLKGVALSGFGREEDVQSSKAAGFSEHLTKPVNFDALVKAVERVGTTT